MVIVGGQQLDGDRPGQPLDSVLRFAPATQSLAVAGRLERPRALVRSVLRPDGRVLMFGGDGPEGYATPSAGSYRAGDARPLAPMPMGRTWHTVNALPDGRVLILGGDTADGWAVGGALLYE